MVTVVDLAVLGVLLACPVLCGAIPLVSYLLPRYRHAKNHDGAGRGDPACPFCGVAKSVLASGKKKDSSA